MKAAMRSDHKGFIKGYGKKFVLYSVGKRALANILKKVSYKPSELLRIDSS